MIPLCKIEPPCSKKMDRIWLFVLLVCLFFVIPSTKSVEDDVKDSLVTFLTQISGNNNGLISSLGWNMSSDPCIDEWEGISCVRTDSVKKVALDGYSLTGTLDLGSLCKVQSLQVISLQNNSISGEVTQEIGNCNQLTQFLISNNKVSGVLPESIAGLNNLKRLHISNNDLSGDLPDLGRISGIVSFLAENNHLTGELPKFDYGNLQLFNVSNNNFRGDASEVSGHFTVSSLIGNPELCGGPLSNPCPPPAPKKKKSKDHSVQHILMYSGYILIGLIVAAFIAFKFMAKKKKKNTGEVVDASDYKPCTTSSEYKTGASKDHSTMTSAESAMMSWSIVVLSSPVVKGLKFEDLLKAPAELLGRGKHSTLYKVILDDGLTLAVKRIKDWAITGDDFKKRMQKLDQVKHHSVLPAVGYYCSKQEKLLVYKYQENGSLFRLLHGNQNGGQSFDWTGRLSIAASVAEGLAFMHKKLLDDGIPHGNLKSSNILFNHNMDPYISEYGLMVVENQGAPPVVNSYGYKSMNDGGDRAYRIFKVDMHGFGVILLELLTGKLVENGLELARWVHSVLREEWTVEVFDKNLIKQGASEQGMVNLLQLALKCIDPAPESRPNMYEISVMLNSIKEEQESSMVSQV